MRPHRPCRHGDSGNARAPGQLSHQPRWARSRRGAHCHRTTTTAWLTDTRADNDQYRRARRPARTPTIATRTVDAARRPPPATATCRYASCCEGRQIVDVQALTLPSDRSTFGRDQLHMRNRLLRTEVLQAQSREHRPRLRRQLHQRGICPVSPGGARSGRSVTTHTHDASRTVRVERHLGHCDHARRSGPDRGHPSIESSHWFQRVDNLFSTWRPDSEISRLARGGAEVARGECRGSRRCSSCATGCSAESCGAFDIRVGADPRVRRARDWARDRSVRTREGVGVGASGRPPPRRSP